jgi:hypothetical protein
MTEFVQDHHEKPLQTADQSPRGRETTMTDADALTAAKSILEKRSGEPEFVVVVDNPTDSQKSINAFRKLGCKVRVENDGRRLKVSPAEANS